MLALDRHPRRLRALLPAALALALLLSLLAALAESPAPAGAQSAGKGNASAAIGFLEDAQNDDGGFGPRKGAGSTVRSSLWAAVALLAGGKHPLDEFNKGGDSLDGYLRDRRDDVRSLTDLGLLALVQGSTGYGPRRYRDPAAELRRRLTEPAVRADNKGAALAALGLIAVGDTQTATSVAQTLLASVKEDGGWGSSDSESTALVLQALAKTGVADATNPAVTRGVEYLKTAQANDGAVMASIRTDPASTGGEVGATAFAIQAVAALGIPAPKTPTGKTFRQGLTQYQQQTTGGLSSNGALYDTTFAPSIVETAQAFPAFNGTTFPLDQVAARTSGPPKKAPKSAASPGSRSKKVSSGTSATGVSDTASANTRDQGAFQNAKTGEQGTNRRGTQDREGSREEGGEEQGSQAGGDAVTGQVVGATSAPKLATRAGQEPDALSAQDRAAIGVGVLLLIALLLGGYSSGRAPRRDDRPRSQVALIALGRGLRAARARGALAPAAAVLVGLALVALPTATKMWDRAPQGEQLIDAFAPHITAERVEAYQRDLGDLDAAVTETGAAGLRRLYPGVSETRARTRLARDAPLLAGVLEQWPRTERSLSSVVDPIAQHREGYEAIAALPRFGAFPWFFVVPGALLLLLGAVALAAPRTLGLARIGLALVAVGLLAAPVALQLWDRAPKGAEMLDAFATVETRPAVVRVQNDFGQVALIQGAIASELVPQLRATGLSARQVERRFPAARRVDRRFVEILNTFTPVIGAMSDNVARYQAVAALPSFRVFPWLFTGAGALVLLALALAARDDRRRRPRAGTPDPAPDGGSAPPRAPEVAGPAGAREPELVATTSVVR